MAKPKINGLGGCYDTELTTPEHDVLCFSLLKDGVAKKILYIVHSILIRDMDLGCLKIINYRNNRLLGLEKEGERWIMTRQDKVTVLLPCEIDFKPSTKLEIPIKNGSYLIGVVDALIEGKIDIRKKYKAEFVKAYWNKEPYVSRFDNIPSVEPDEIGTETYVWGWSASEQAPVTIYIEVKPKIKSFGEVLRQISIYRSYVRDTAVFVIFTNEVSKEMKDAFLTQNVYVITPDDLKEVKED